MAEDVGQAYVSIVPTLRGFSARLKAELATEMRGVTAPIERAGNQAGQGFGDRMREGLRSRLSGIATVLKTGLVAGTAAAVAGLGALTAFGLRSAAAMEQTTIGIEALVGNAEDAKKFLGELQQFAKITPFGFADTADAARRILAFGQSVGITRDQVLPTLTVIGDLVSVLGGTSESVESVIRALGQMASKGKLSQEEILQLAEALPGFNANAAIASHLGLSVADTLQKITAGEVDATTGINALLAGMAKFPGAAGAMERQSQTLAGVWAAFQDTMAIALTNAFSPVIPTIKQTLNDITPVFGDALDQLAPALGGLLSQMLPLISQIAGALVPVLTPVLDIVSQLLASAGASGGIVALGEAFGQVAGTLAPLAPLLGDTLGTVLTSLAPVIAALAPLVADLVGPLGEVLVAVTPIIPPLAELVALGLPLSTLMIRLAAALLGLLASKVVAPIIEGIAWVLGKVADAARPVLEKFDTLAEIGEILKGVGRWIADAFGTVVDWFEQLPDKIGGFLSSLPQKIGGAFQTALEQGAYWIGFGIGKAIRFFVDLPGKVIEAAKDLGPKLVTWAGEALGTLRDKVSEGIGKAIQFFKDLPGNAVDAVKDLGPKILEKLKTLPGQMLQLGRDIVEGAINGIKEKIAGIGSALKDGFDAALRGVKDGLGIHSPSTVYMELGQQTIAGYTEGIERSARAARQATVDALAPAASPSRSATQPAAPAPIPLRADDALTSAALDLIRNKIASTYGGDVNLAFTLG